MPIITPTPIAALPPAPVKGQAGFNAAAELYLSALVNPFTPQVNAAIAATNANALSAEQSAITAQAAAAGIDVPMWASGNNYQAGRGVKSPLAIAAGASPVYICKVEISGGTADPYNDPAHWSIFTVSGGVGGAVYTTSTALTSSSPFTISISGGSGVWLKLPDATQLSTGIRHAVRNTGDNDLTVLDSTGATIGFIRPQCGTTISLSDSSTAAGKWVGDWEMYGITADLSLNLSIASSTIFSSAIKIDNNRTMFLYGSNGSGLYAVVYDTSTQTATDSLLVRASFNNCMAILIGGNVGILTCDSSTALQIALVSPACALVSTATATASGTVNSFGQFIALGTGYVFSYSTSAPSVVVRAISVSGTTLSIGAEVSLASIEAPRLYVNGNYLMALRHNNSSAIYCTPYTLSGNTLTAGTAANTPAATYSSTLYRSDQLDNGDIIVFHVYNYNLVLSAFKLSSGTVSVYSSNVISWGNANISISSFAHIKLTNNRIAIGALSAGNTPLYAAIATNTSTSPTISAAASIAATSDNNLKPTASGFATGGINNSFDFSGATPIFNGISRYQTGAYSQDTYGLYFDSMSNFGKNIVSSKSGMVYAMIGDSSYNQNGVLALSSKASFDNPHKIKMAITQNPRFYGESKSSCLSVYSVTYNYGFRVQRVKCID